MIKIPKTIKCPDCQEDVEVKGQAQVGDIIECQNCASEMEIVSLEPLQVSLIEEEK